jgi:hypothetical protein
MPAVESMGDEELARLAQRAKREDERRSKERAAAKKKAIVEEMRAAVTVLFGDLDCEMSGDSIRGQHGSIKFTVSHQPYNSKASPYKATMYLRRTFGPDSASAIGSNPHDAVSGALREFASGLARIRRGIVQAQSQVAAIRVLLRSSERYGKTVACEQEASDV